MLNIEKSYKTLNKNGKNFLCIVLKFNLEQNVEPNELQKAIKEVKDVIDEKDFSLPFFVSGRGPVFLYCGILHELHPACAAGIFVPSNSYYIITQSHVNNLQVGDSLELVGDELE